MKTFYRISDNGYSKPKLPGADHSACIENFSLVFGKIDHLVFDNCSERTVESFSKYGESVHVTSLGNAGSFMFCLDIACQLNGEQVYMVEDDYLHRPGSADAIMDGLELGDYATLYDHPDKYGKMYGMGETCKLMRFRNWHWKTSVSTTMTFASVSDTLRKDREVFSQVCAGKFHPNDHEIFTNLGDLGRRLVVSVPGISFHTDISSQIMNLDSPAGEIDSWALSMMEKVLVYRVYKTNDGDLVEMMENAITTLSGLPLLHELDRILADFKQRR